MTTRAQVRQELKSEAMRPKRIKKSRLTKQKRRTKKDIAELREAIYETIKEDHPLTVRQTFYRLVARQIIPKTQNQYKGTVVRLMGLMRRDGQLPFDWVADNTRWMRKPTTYGSMESLLRNAQQTYRRAVWDNQDVYVEVWCESDAVSGVLVDATAEWDVPLMVSRGFSSVTFLHSAAEMIDAIGKPTFLYYFGDYDPSGVHIDRTIEADLRVFAPDADIHFERIAVTASQIEEWELPGNPAKQSDSRSKGFKGESVEIEAIPPQTLRDICRQCIAQHVDRDAHKALLVIEEEERHTLEMVTDDYFDVA